MRRTVAVASPDIAPPVVPFNTCARFTYSPSVTPAPTASSSLTVRDLGARDDQAVPAERPARDRRLGRHAIEKRRARDVA